jgi:glutamyl-tRNA reductase
VIAHLGARSQQIAEALLGSYAGIAGLFPLVTCNRVEFYLDVERFPDAIEAMLSAVSSAAPQHAAALMDGFEVWAGDDAVLHLFEVASGLDSMVVGDAEITGQVRDSLSEWSAHLTPDLRRLGQAALASTRAMNARVRLGDAGRSLSSIGLDLAIAPGLGWTDARVLVLGTGNYAGIVVADLQRRGCDHILVHSRSGQAERFAATHPVTPVTDLTGALAEVDLVVAAGGRREALLRAETLGRHRPAILDLTGGDDVHTDVRGVPGVRLVTIDDIGEHAPARDTEAVREARDIVQGAVDDFLDDQRARRAAPTVVALRARVQQLVEAEIDATGERHPPETVEIVTRALNRVAAALLHDPSVRASESARNGELREYQQALATVFGIEVEP